MFTECIMKNERTLWHRIILLESSTLIYKYFCREIKNKVKIFLQIELIV